jgi:diamine N-acetyltransferase
MAGMPAIAKRTPKDRYMTTPPGDTSPILNITGALVALGPHDRALLPLYVKWANDFEVTRYYFSRLTPVTREQREQWFERMSAGAPNVVEFAIYERATWRPIGYTMLDDIDYQHGSATYGILLGEKDCWGKGYGTETTRLMLAYGFGTLGLHSVMLRASASNERALRAYQRAGFRIFGTRHEVWRRDDQWQDEVYMECLASEFDLGSVPGNLGNFS